jgi:hypothetical protein
MDFEIYREVQIKANHKISKSKKSEIAFLLGPPYFYIGACNGVGRIRIP